MHFNTTTIAPRLDARVTVKFAGLLLLKPAGKRCEIGIHRLSSTHAFQVMLIVSRPDRPPNLTRLLTGPLTTPIEISVDPDPGTGVQAFVSSAGKFERSQANNEFDFRWALDIQELHMDKKVDFNDGARPVAILNAGTLYTPTLTRIALSPVLVRGEETKPLHQFSADLGAAIDLPAPSTPTPSTVTLSWQHEGEPRTYTLPREFDPEGVRYTVVLLNDPPISSAASHDEFAHYYEVLESKGKAIPGTEQFRIEYNGGPTTDEIPCMPVLLSSST